MLNPSLIKAFIAVIDNGSMNKAAKVLGCSQSTVSRLIEQLEDETGLDLFERSFTSRRLCLTEQGEAIERHARYTMDVNQSLMHFCQSLSMDVEKEMRIAMPTLLERSFVRQFCAQLVKAFPTTRFSFLDPSPYEIEEMIHQGSCDIGINVFLMEPERGVNSVGIGTIAGCFVIHPEHEMASVNFLDMDSLEKETQITFLMPSQENYRAELNYSKYIIEAATVEQTLLLTEAGLGYSIIPLHMLPFAEKHHGLIQIRSELDPRLVIPVHGMYRQLDAHRPVTRWIREYLVQHWVA